MQSRYHSDETDAAKFMREADNADRKDEAKASKIELRT